MYILNVNHNYVNVPYPRNPFVFVYAIALILCPYVARTEVTFLAFLHMYDCSIQNIIYMKSDIIIIFYKRQTTRALVSALTIK